jgi:hypothetical protein
MNKENPKSYETDHWGPKPLDWFITQTSPDGALTGGMLGARGIAGILGDLTKILAPPTKIGKGPQEIMYIRGGSVIGYAYGKDPYPDAPVKALRNLQHAAVNSEVIQAIEGYVPDLDLYVKIPRDIGMEEVKRTLLNSIMASTEGIVTTRDDGVVVVRNRAFDKARVELNVGKFGGVNGINDRIMARINVVNGDKRYGIEIAQDIEEDIPVVERYDVDSLNMRLNVHRLRLDLLTVYDVYLKDGRLIVDAVEPLAGNNPYTTSYRAPKIGFSQIYNMFIRAARITSQCKLEAKFDFGNMWRGRQRRSGFLGLLEEAVEGSKKNFDLAFRRVITPSEDQDEKNIYEIRSLPLAKIDIVVGLARNPFRFLGMLYAMKDLMSYMPISAYGNVLGAMINRFGKDTGRRFRSIEEASQTYENGYLTGGMNGESGLDMLANITGVRDVVSLFVPKFE